MADLKAGCGHGPYFTRRAEKHLSPKERLALFLEALAGGDEAERDRLINSAREMRSNFERITD